MSLIFIRHAQSQGNATGDYSVATHDSLSELGRRQARCLAAALAHQPIARVLVSPLTRAMQTIHPYLVSTGQVAEVWPELAEGCWQLRELAVADDFPSEPFVLSPDLAPQFRFRDGEPLRPCEHETYAQGLYRARLVLERLKPYALDAADTLVVTHGHMLREILNLVAGSTELVRFPHDNCAMTCVGRESDGWVIHYTNRPTWKG